MAIYNGLNVADGYWTSYPLDYKHRFRQLIAPELAAVPTDATYFDTWGSRAYVFQPDTGQPVCCGSPSHPEIDLLVDPTQWALLDIAFVVSTGPITNATEMRLEHRATVDRLDGIGPLYVYEVVDSAA